MKILDLPLKKKWYNMIESGVKREEYREIKPYWKKRLLFCYEAGGWCDECYCISCPARVEKMYSDYTHVRFRYGYTKRTMLYELGAITIGKGKKEWGAPDYDVFILKLGERVDG